VTYVFDGSLAGGLHSVWTGGARPRRGRAMARSRHHPPCAGAALARRQSDERAQGGLRRLRAVAPAGLSVAVASGASEVRIGLAAGARRIRTIGPWLERAGFGSGRRIAGIERGQPKKLFLLRLR